MPALTNQVRGPNSKLECYYIVIELNFKKMFLSVLHFRCGLRDLRRFLPSMNN